ncbi:hypothetical protein QF045_002577 [Pseudomonas sp. W4I3]|nr:hypothetical protein [Pseudomonas sp. W4I3]
MQLRPTELIERPHVTGGGLHVTVDHGDVPAAFGHGAVQQLADLHLSDRVEPPGSDRKPSVIACTSVLMLSSRPSA